MASVSTVEQYRELAAASGLVRPEQLADAVSEWARAGAAPDPASFASLLLARQWITPWQNSHLMAGRSRGFFLGRYVLLAPLGKGGMARVYLAQHLEMKRRVAIKVLDAMAAAGARERFLREAQIVAALDHPHIVRAHDFDASDRVPFLVMEYIEGQDLRSLVEDRGTLGYVDAAEYIRQAAHGLDHAHSRGVVHRDVKPGNLLLDKHGTIKILDMGLALMQACEISASSADDIVGTADYLAPEQVLHSRSVDHRADLYSLGGTLYFLLTGHPPFPEGTLGERMIKHQRAEPASIFQRRPDAPADLVAICQRLMSKRPQDRFQTAAEVAQRMAQWLEQDRQPPPSAIHQDLVDARESVHDTVTLGRTDTHVRRHPQGPHRAVHCAACGRKYLYDPRLVGRVLPCNHCRGEVRMEPPAQPRIACPHCGQRHLLDPQLRGETVQCRACRQLFQIPAARAAGAPVKEQG